ncbi:methyltransferase-like 26 isoform X2 [Struthio camelus]|uniref:methyltransferase-like 26 isoform X2 n=1 Tax=Struthio camelus TaxID=8801 RepID=UPI0036040078
MLRAAAAERNKGPILAVLREYVGPGAVRVLEVGAGSGLHAVHCARALPHVLWQPSDVDPRALQRSLAGAQCAATHLPGCLAELGDMGWHPAWHPGPRHQHQHDAHLRAAVHGGPVQGSRSVAEAQSFVSPQPYAIGGRISPQSNVDFDCSLRQRNPAWGLRDTDLLQQLAEANGMCLERMVDMPANNKCLIFRKQ